MDKTHDSLVRASQFLSYKEFQSQGQDKPSIDKLSIGDSLRGKEINCDTTRGNKNERNCIYSHHKYEKTYMKNETKIEQKIFRQRYGRETY